MTVYIDHAFAYGEWGRWTGGGHLQADDVEELHAFAARMGMHRQWFQSTPGRPEKDHYDLTAAGREIALRLGAVDEDRRTGAQRRKTIREDRRQVAPGPQPAGASVNSVSDGTAPDFPLILLVSGSLRDGSVNAAVLRTAAALAPGAIATETYAGLADLPPFSPDDDREGATPPPAVAALRAQLDRADAILFCTPEYAGSLPGSFKNLLDWSVGGGETYGLPVAWINASGPAAPTGGAGAHAALRSVLTYTGTVIIDDACRRVPVTRDTIGPDGLVSDGVARTQIAAAVDALAAAVRHQDRHAPDPAERVAAADAAFFAALRSADADALDALLADDFMIVEVGAGTVHTRDAFLGAVRQGHVRFTAIDTDPAESLVRVHGALAVVIGSTRMTMAGALGAPGTVHSRYTHVFDTDGGAWRLRSAQGTAISGAPGD